MKTLRQPRRTSSQWHQAVEAQIASGISAPKFCKEQDISYASFINWKKKIGNVTNSEVPSAEPRFIELTSPADSVQNKVFEKSNVTIELDIGPGIQLRILQSS